MNGRIAKLLLAAALSTASMFGTTVTMSFGSNSTAFPTGEIGPYVANVGGMTEFVFCDDDTHTVYPNETWTATATSLSSLVALGNSNVATGSNVLWKGLAGAVTLYEEAAWLVYQFGSSPAADYGGLQNAIWDTFLGKAGTGSASDKTTDAYWLLKASTNYSTLTTAQIANTVILTPVAGSQNPLSDGQPQEFIMVTPEPASYVLFGMGVILISLGSIRKHRQNA
jgi:hypothetical protein